MPPLQKISRYTHILNLSSSRHLSTNANKRCDVCRSLVYGAEPRILQQAPGGRDNAKVVGKQFFENFSLPHDDGNYFRESSKRAGVNCSICLVYCRFASFRILTIHFIVVEFPT